MDYPFYLYRHIRLDTGLPFYIGIGKKSSVFSSHKSEYKRAFQKTRRNQFWKNITNKCPYKIEILLESTSETHIREKEIEFINLYGRRDLNKGSLTNLIDGTLSIDNRRKVPVFAYNEDGSYHSQFNSITDAANYFKIKHSHICENMSKKRLQAKKIRFFKIFLGEKIDTLEEYIIKTRVHSPQEFPSKSVRGWSIDKTSYKEYKTITTASRDTGADTSYISKVCQGKAKTAGGKIWEYIN